MKKLIAVFCILFSLALYAQTPLKLVTFNSLTGKHSNVADITGVTSIYSPVGVLHPSTYAAIAPERDWYIFIGKSGNQPDRLYTVDIISGNTVYSTPAWFKDYFTEFYYSDTIEGLIGIYTDTAGTGATSLATCNLQTGAITILAPMNQPPRMATYNHETELYYFFKQSDTMLYWVCPALDLVDSAVFSMNFPNGAPFVSAAYRPMDMQCDELHNELYLLCNRQVNGPDGVGIIRLDMTSFTIDSNYSPPVMEPFAVSNEYHHLTFDAQNYNYVFPLLGNGTSGSRLYAADVAWGTAISFNMYDTINNEPGIFPYDSIVSNFAYHYTANTIYGVIEAASPTTGVAEVEANANWGIFPNPAGPSATIYVEEKLIGSNVVVSDITGRQMAAFNITSNYLKLNTAAWPAGVYVVSLIGDKLITTKKLVVQH